MALRSFQCCSSRVAKCGPVLLGRNRVVSNFGPDVKEDIFAKKAPKTAMAKRENRSVVFGNTDNDTKEPALPMLLGHHNLILSPPDSTDGTDETAVSLARGSRAARGRQDHHSQRSSSKKACDEIDEADDASEASTEFGHTSAGGDILEMVDENRNLAQRARLALFNRHARRDIRFTASGGIV